MANFYSNGQKARNTPLSQASGKKKLLIGVPVSIIGGILWALHLPLGMPLCVFLGAYAIVGLIEVVGGDALKAKAAKWDAFPGWKKLLIASAVICACLFALGLLLPFLVQ